VPKRTDKNQRQIVETLRQLGASVWDVHSVGRGGGDLVVGWRGSNLLIEVKSGSGTLTPDEKEFHATWRGQIAIVRTLADVLKLLGIVER
jgi:hypothetical protein